MRNFDHVCPHCGRKIKCDWKRDSQREKTRDFESGRVMAHPVALPPGLPFRTIQYEVYWGIRTITDALVKSLAVWIPVNAIALGVSMYEDWSPVVPQVFSIASLIACLRMFGKVMDWENVVETNAPPAPISAPEPADEDERNFAGWASVESTKTTQRIEWYTPPCPIVQARSYALALVNRKFDWVDERRLRDDKVGISGPNYRRLRQDWIRREWIGAVGGNRTVIYNKSMIRRIAFESPE